ncbi:UvrB/UvrC motif-containing protein [Ruminococcus sp. YE282]|jgi:protein arginine kinase activator|uniref:UvrB/UvrC motif-containing protein n=1 Tax=Ruminococcus sp. YE282 TaxID=3158780 RepID=UPI00089187BA|nr:UvrB/UvrC motif-containing protein [Ruminococcus bromii]MEE3498281.1 UvrB/UvrC motif-containing protein [Ruminococcus bromii]SCY07393.1 Protein-arginine kinase activator protein McsA [Ruminococcus bromii]
MKCQKCGANNANTHVKTIINGEFKEYDLCSDCAKKMGYTNVFSDMEDEFSNFLGSFFGNVLPARTQATRCEFCGTTYPEIAKTGHVGCAKCYDVFADELYPSIRRIHGNTTHCGKNSKRAENAKTEKPAEQTKEDKIKALKAELDKAVKEQNFEHAAELRDKIKEMEA